MDDENFLIQLFLNRINMYIREQNFIYAKICMYVENFLFLAFCGFKKPKKNFKLSKEKLSNKTQNFYFQKFCRACFKKYMFVEKRLI